MSADAVRQALNSIQTALYERALKFREDHTTVPENYDAFKNAVEGGFAYTYWCGSAQCEQSIKDDTKATLRCIPLEQNGEKGACIYCGQPAEEMAYFAKAY